MNEGLIKKSFKEIEKFFCKIVVFEKENLKVSLMKDQKAIVLLVLCIPQFSFNCEDKKEQRKPQNPKFKHVNNNNKYFDIPYISYNILK